MSSSSSENSNNKLPAYFMCPVCYDHLQEYTSPKQVLINLFCGHVYHEQCWKDWCKKLNEKKRRGDPWKFRCVICGTEKDTDCAKILYLDAQVNHSYVDMIKSNKRMRLDNEDLQKQIRESSIKLHALKNETEELRHKLVGLRWEDLTEPFRDELISKLKMSCKSLRIDSQEFSFISLNTMFELIRNDSNENSIVLKLCQDIYSSKSSLNETISLDNFKEFFNFELLDCLRKACNIPQLDLFQLPVSPSILHILLTSSKERILNDKGIIIKILQSFICVDFSTYTKQLLTIMLVNLVVDQVHFAFEISLPSVSRSLQSYLVTCKILKLTNDTCVFSHDSVAFFLMGILVAIVKKKFDLSLSDACIYMCKARSGFQTLDDYIIGYINNVSEFTNSTSDIEIKGIIKAFKFFDGQLKDLFVILAIMKANKSKLFTDIFSKMRRYYTSVSRTIWDIKLPCKVDSCEIKLMLPDFAAIRGRHEVMRILYDLFSSEQKSKYFEIRRLVQLGASWTLNRTDSEILERGRMISYLLSLNECSHQNLGDKSKASCLTVNVLLLKTVAEKGLTHFLHIWDAEQIFEEVFPNVTTNDAARLTLALVDQVRMIELLENYDKHRPITV